MFPPIDSWRECGYNAVRPMDVKCDRCQAEFEFEETLASPAGTAVKCTSCGNLFKVMPPVTQQTPEQTTSRWTWRRTSGETVALDSLRPLGDAIIAGRVSPDDEISHTGRRWRRVGDIAELAALFPTPLDSENVREADWYGDSRPPPAVPQEAIGHRTNLSSPSTPPLDAATEAARRPSVRPTPAPPPSDDLEAWEGITATQPGTNTEPLPEPLIAASGRGRGWARQPGLMWLVASVLLGSAVALVGAWLMISPRLEDGPTSEAAATSRYVEEGDQALAQHDPVHFERAVTAYTKALAQHEHDPYLLSALSRTYAYWSQYLRLHRHLVSQVAPDDVTTQETLAAGAARWAERARTAAETAAHKNPGNAFAEVALADALRLDGNLVAARAELDRAGADGDGGDPEALRVAAWLAIDEAAGDASAGRTFAEQAVARAPDLVYRTQLVFILLATGDLETAEFHMAKLRVEAPGGELGALFERWAERIREGGAPQATQADQGASDQTLTDAEPDPCALGNAALTAGRVADAGAHFAAALAEQPPASCAQLGMGQVHLRRGRHWRALPLLRSAARRGEVEAWVGVGAALQALRRPGEAEQSYARYLRAAPHGPMAETAQKELDVIRRRLAERSPGGANNRRDAPPSADGIDMARETP